MRLICRDNLGAPLAMIKVHPLRNRLISFSASCDEAFLWGWGAGRLKRLARLGIRRNYASTQTIQVLGHEVELPRGDLARDAGFHPDGIHLATVGERRPIEVYRVFDGKPIRTIADTSASVDVTTPSGLGQMLWELLPKPQAFTRIAFSASGRFIISGPVAGLCARVYEFQTGTPVGSLWEGFEPYAVDRRWEVLAMVRNDQGGTLIRFANCRSRSGAMRERLGGGHRGSKRAMRRTNGVGTSLRWSTYTVWSSARPGTPSPSAAVWVCMMTAF